MSSLSPARRLALEVGFQVRRRHAFTSNVLDGRLADKKLHMSAADRAFARVLALGVTQMQGTLDDIINCCIRSPHDIKPNVRDALRISTYEIFYLDKPAHVAVDQGVELVRSVASRASGLANFVLRKEITLKADFPFGDPRVDDAALARLCGFPLWLTKFLIEQMGREDAWNFMRISNTPAPVYIAVNAIKTSVQDVMHCLDDNNVHTDTTGARDKKDLQDFSCVKPLLSPVQHVYGCIKAQDARLIATSQAHKLFANGNMLVSDAAAQSIAHLAVPKAYPTHGFLEVGAGRATKTILLQSYANHVFSRQMPLYCIDSEQFKTDIIARRTRIYGVQTKGIICGDGRDLDHLFPQTLFDGVFIDAPCSGLGTLRRHPEIRWRITQKDIQDLAVLDAQLLISASKHVAPKGQLTYATCTVSDIENEAVIEKFLSSPYGKDFSIVPVGNSSSHQTFFKSVLTEDACDAHFAVRMVRKG